VCIGSCAKEVASEMISGASCNHQPCGPAAAPATPQYGKLYPRIWSPPWSMDLAESAVKPSPKYFLDAGAGSPGGGAAPAPPAPAEDEGEAKAAVAAGKRRNDEASVAEKRARYLERRQKR
jgi:hypothetical protein